MDERADKIRYLSPSGLAWLCVFAVGVLLCVLGAYSGDLGR